jgi:hypothetical protein
MLAARSAGALDIGEKGMNDLLYRLGVEGEPAFGG